MQSNLGLFAFLAWALSRNFGGRSADAPLLKGAVTLYIAITGLVFHLVLMNPSSPFSVASEYDTVGLRDRIENHLLHTVTPVLAVLDWLLFDQKGRFRWRYAWMWLAYPLLYFGFALVRGALLTGPWEYPYPFLNPEKLGVGGLALSASGFALAFYLLGLGFVAVDRWSASGVDPPARGRL